MKNIEYEYRNLPIPGAAFLLWQTGPGDFTMGAGPLGAP